MWVLILSLVPHGPLVGYEELTGFETSFAASRLLLRHHFFVALFMPLDLFHLQWRYYTLNTFVKQAGFPTR